MLEYPMLTLLVIAPFAEKVQQAERQRQAVEAIEKAGQYVFYDYQIDEFGRVQGKMETSGEITRPEPPYPAWLGKLVGDDFFSDVACILCKYHSNGDVVLKHARGLTNLNRLQFGPKVTDTGMENLERLTRLTQLSLSSTKVTDDGLEHLKGLTQLKYLYLSCTKVTDDGLECLRGLTELESLWLTDTQVTDDGLGHLLRGRTKLKGLSLGSTQITDGGLEHLRGLAKI